MQKEKTVVFDVDGVLLKTDYIFEEIFKLKLKGDAKWDYFREHCNSERTEPFKDIVNLWYKLAIGYRKVFISTARNEKCREATHTKLWNCGFIIPEECLLMRKDKDYRSAVEVKKEHLFKIMENYDIVAFIDDDLANCEMAKELGILALRRV